MTRILTPLWENSLKKVLLIYAEKLNEEYFEKYNNSNTIIHLIDSLRKSYSSDRNKLLTIELNHSFITEYNQWNIPLGNYNWKRNDNLPVSVSQLPPGIYNYQFITGDGEVSKGKLVKE